MIISTPDEETQKNVMEEQSEKAASAKEYAADYKNYQRLQQGVSNVEKGRDYNCFFVTNGGSNGHS